MACKDWDEGWCYAEGTKYISGCVGEDDCEYKTSQPSRIDIVASNGNTGEHYTVERIARALAGPDADMKMMGQNSGKRRWELYIKKAIEIYNILEKE